MMNSDGGAAYSRTKRRRTTSPCPPPLSLPVAFASEPDLARSPRGCNLHRVPSRRAPAAARRRAAAENTSWWGLADWQPDCRKFRARHSGLKMMRQRLISVNGTLPCFHASLLAPQTQTTGNPPYLPCSASPAGFFAHTQIPRPRADS
ncbi:hypothetical protein HU200_025727 [Digitaria exilis]|uniref:Uncharacterized protein n=1 Tax=Digitaria exilis TaxID=1010633 RepID=A0A835EXU0_9POAL|nr:hypothetical protein HU200_025727 [Digitaria exilis]